MNQPSSRKEFFAKLLGAAAVSAALPQAIASSSGAAAPATSGRPARKIEIRADARSVARRDMV
ncbi:MAG: hypothetical protein JNK23_17610 [Opitutaceae bacterium]|nr:hypothetical protein [Opitutaceae bacterium]